ncbi:MAG: energy-coupling factor transporter transmembrane protein EcfT [Cellvibrionaceae bacterium]|jgi:energy-coupling factor transporter transmembrane protein EcfT
MDQLTQLVDLPRLFFNSLWILGLAIIFAALSMHHYLAQEKKIPLRKALQSPDFQLFLWGGLTIVTIGFAGNANQSWEQLVWLALTLLNGVQVFFAFREKGTNNQ